MDATGVRKRVNTAKATYREKRQSPVGRSQEDAPIAEAVEAFWARDTLTFAIPAHLGGRGGVPEFAQWAGMDAARVDIGMSHGIDRRDRSWGVQEAAQQLFAEAAAPSRRCSRPTAAR